MRQQHKRAHEQPRTHGILLKYGPYIDQGHPLTTYDFLAPTSFFVETACGPPFLLMIIKMSSWLS